MQPAQIMSLFGKSLFDGSNRLLLDAILNAPAGFEMLPANTIRKLREVRIKRFVAGIDIFRAPAIMNASYFMNGILLTLSR